MISVSHFQKVVDWVFPPLCIHCSREASWLCIEAIRQLSELRPMQINDLPFPVYMLGSYDHPILGSLVRKIKYQGWHALNGPVHYVVSKIVPLLPPLPTETVVVPIPLHTRRERERGFNQSDIIARAVSRVTGLQTCKLIIRKNYTRPQVGLAADKRSRNLHGAFRLSPTIASIPKCVILVDDVMTTGATMRECTDILLPAGVERIVGVALARG